MKRRKRLTVETVEKIWVTAVVVVLVLWVAMLIFIVGPDAIHDTPKLWHDWKVIFNGGK